MKTSKVVAKEKWASLGKDGKQTFTIKFENGDEGWFRSPDLEGTYFEVDKVANYEFKPNPKNKSQFWVEIPKDAPKPSDSIAPSKSGAVLSHEELKFRAKLDAVSFASAYTKDLVVNDKIELEAFNDTASKFIKFMQEQIEAVK